MDFLAESTNQNRLHVRTKSFCLDYAGVQRNTNRI